MSWLVADRKYRPDIISIGSSRRGIPLTSDILLTLSVGHPLIHLGYAFEVDSRELCMEALTLASVTYSPMHKYIDDKSYGNQPPAYETTSPLEGLARVAADSRFDNVFSGPGGGNFSTLFSNPLLEQAILSHWNSLKMPDPT